MKNERDECIHGSLRRSCEICERDAEIDRLSDLLAIARARIKELEHNLEVNGIDFTRKDGD